MRPEKYDTHRLVMWFSSDKVLSLKQIAEALQQPSRPTLFRKLTEISARASYSHGGRYHALERLIDFDEYGLWHFGDIGFSRYGTLMATLVHLVEHSTRGYCACELAALLNVRVHNALTHQYQTQRLMRVQRGDQYVYLSPLRAERQMVQRDRVLEQEATQNPGPSPDDQWAEHVRVLLPALNEKQRRLLLGLESLRIGHGGDARLSRLTGVSVHTIARGRRELAARNVSMDRIRRAGAGRPSVEKKRQS